MFGFGGHLRAYLVGSACVRGRDRHWRRRTYFGVPDSAAWPSARWYARSVGIRHDLPAAVYALHHPALAAVKIGCCLEPREKRIRQHTSKGWILLADFGAPSGWDAMAIERKALATLTPRTHQVYDSLDTVIPGHAAFRTEIQVSRRRELHVPGDMPANMPQGGVAETFSVGDVSPERAQLALWYVEIQHRAHHYPTPAEGRDWEQDRRDAIREVKRRRVVY